MKIRNLVEFVMKEIHDLELLADNTNVCVFKRGVSLLIIEKINCTLVQATIIEDQEIVLNQEFSAENIWKLN